MNKKLRSSILAATLSVVMILSLPNGVDNEYTLATDTRLPESIEMQTAFQNYETLNKLKAEKLEAERQEELKRKIEEQQRLAELASRSNQGRTYIGEFTLSAYCSCAKCCGTANNRCANGKYPKDQVTIAADTRVIPMGSKVYIDGIGERIVMDTGGAIKNNKIDVYMSTHTQALQFGIKKKIKVWIVE